MTNAAGQREQPAFATDLERELYEALKGLADGISFVGGARLSSFDLPVRHAQAVTAIGKVEGR